MPLDSNRDTCTTHVVWHKPWVFWAGCALKASRFASLYICCVTVSLRQRQTYLFCEVPFGRSTIWWCSIWQGGWNIPCPLPSPNPLPCLTPPQLTPPCMIGRRQGGPGRIDKQGRIDDITDAKRDFALQLPWALLLVSGRNTWRIRRESRTERRSLHSHNAHVGVRFAMSRGRSSSLSSLLRFSRSASRTLNPTTFTPGASRAASHRARSRRTSNVVFATQRTTWWETQDAHSVNSPTPQVLLSSSALQSLAPQLELRHLHGTRPTSITLYRTASRTNNVTNLTRDPTYFRWCGQPSRLPHTVSVCTSLCVCVTVTSERELKRQSQGGPTTPILSYEHHLWREQHEWVWHKCLNFVLFTAWILPFLRRVSIQVSCSILHVCALCTTWISPFLRNGFVLLTVGASRAQLRLFVRTETLYLNFSPFTDGPHRGPLAFHTQRNVTSVTPTPVQASNIQNKTSNPPSLGYFTSWFWKTKLSSTCRLLLFLISYAAASSRIRVRGGGWHGKYRSPRDSNRCRALQERPASLDASSGGNNQEVIGLCSTSKKYSWQSLVSLVTRVKHAHAHDIALCSFLWHS